MAHFFRAVVYNPCSANSREKGSGHSGSPAQQRSHWTRCDPEKERTDQTERFYRAGTYEVIEFGYNGKGLNNKYVMGKTPQMTTPLLL